MKVAEKIQVGTCIFCYYDEVYYQLYSLFCCVLVKCCDIG